MGRQREGVTKKKNDGTKERLREGGRRREGVTKGLREEEIGNQRSEAGEESK